MQLGISSYSFPWAAGVPGYTHSKKLSAHGLVRLAKKYAINFVQFGDNLPLHELTQRELTDLQRSAKAAGVQLQAGTKGLTIANLERYISIAQQCSSPFIRVVIDDAGYEPGTQEVIKIIKQLLPGLRESGIVLAIENHDRFTAASLKAIIEATDPLLAGICLDTANSLGAGEGIDQVLDLLAPYTVNLHVKDIRIKRVAHNMGFSVEGCAAGEGILDLPGIISRLESFGKCAVATLELWSDPGTDIEQTLIKENRLMEKSIQYLKKILP